MHFKLQVLLPVLFTLSAVSATPIISRDATYPEVIPGPGLPSLASLNLTSAQLYEQGVPKFPDDHILAAQFTGECGPSDAAYTNVNGVIACFNYLKALGTRNCVAGDNAPVQMCRSGNAQALGQALGVSSASSYCSDVALGLLWVINSCTRPDQSVAGFQAANGNGNLIIGGVSTSW